MIEAAAANGGKIDQSPRSEAEEGMPMYGRDFEDPDGHQWEPMWMDPAFAEQGAQGVFLSRLAALPQGRYRLTLATAKTADEAVGTLSVNTTCQTRAAERGLSGARPRVATGRFFHDFTVPEGCPFQWLRLSVASQSGSLSADLNGVNITRLP